MCSKQEPCGKQHFHTGNGKVLIVNARPKPLVVPARSLALFQCTQCGAEEVSWNDRGKVNEPSKCPNPACQVGPLSSCT